MMLLETSSATGAKGGDTEWPTARRNRGSRSIAEGAVDGGTTPTSAPPRAPREKARTARQAKEEEKKEKVKARIGQKATKAKEMDSRPKRADVKTVHQATI